jgi:hypothetical protein
LFGDPSPRDALLANVCQQHPILMRLPGRIEDLLRLPHESLLDLSGTTSSDDNGGEGKGFMLPLRECQYHEFESF